MTIAETLFVQIKLGSSESDAMLDRILGHQKDAIGNLKTLNLSTIDSEITLDNLDDRERAHR